MQAKSCVCPAMTLLGIRSSPHFGLMQEVGWYMFSDCPHVTLLRCMTTFAQVADTSHRDVPLSQIRAFILQASAVEGLYYAAS